MKTKKFFKVLLAAVMLITLCGPICLAAGVPIDNDHKTGTITVAGVEADASVSIYKLTDVSFDYVANQPKENPYAWVESVQNWINANDNYKEAYATPEKFFDAVEAAKKDTEAAISAADLSRNFYSSLSAAIQGESPILTATATKTAEGTATYPVVADKTVTFDGCEMGTYLVLINNAYMVYSPSVVNVTPENLSGTWVLDSEKSVAEIKSTTPTITKTVADKNYSTVDAVPYTIVADIPTYVANSLPAANTFFISDTLAEGLTLNKTSFTVKVAGEDGNFTTTLPEAAYSLNTTDAKADKSADAAAATFSIDFTYSQIKDYKKVQITYTAKLNEDATVVLGTAGNTNTAKLVYNNNPYVATSYQTQTSDQKVFTYGIDITKVDKVETTKTLKGAEFTLKDGETLLNFVKVGDKYYRTNAATEGATTTLAVDDNGRLYVYGLDEGTYTLTETKAPEGYNIPTTPTTIVIADTDKDGKLNDATADDNSGIIKVTVTNSKGFTLPVTGGSGTVMFAVIGTVCIALGAMLIVAVSKKNSANK